jgi:hypothetical protein
MVTVESPVATVIVSWRGQDTATRREEARGKRGLTGTGIGM